MLGEVPFPISLWLSIFDNSAVRVVLLRQCCYQRQFGE